LQDCQYQIMISQCRKDQDLIHHTGIAYWCRALPSGVDASRKDKVYWVISSFGVNAVTIFPQIQAWPRIQAGGRA